MNYSSLLNIVNLSYSADEKEINDKGYNFFKNEDTDTEFIYEVEDNVMTICFRGVDTFKDMIYCFDFFKKKIKGNDKVHIGFYKKFLSVIYNLKILVDLKKIKKFVVVGYSLGGAMANIFVYYLLEVIGVKKKNIELYVLGCPRFGNKDFVKKIEGVKILRYRYGNDFITHLPPLFLGYKEVGELVVFKDKNIFNFIKNHWQYNEV